MTLTVYSNLSLKQIAENLKTLRGYSVKVEKISNNLNKMPSVWPKPLYLEVTTLASRYKELYDKNKWKIEKEMVDEYLVDNFKDIGHLASDKDRELGKDKHSYIDYDQFAPWEGYYKELRDYCINLSLLSQMSIELQKRYFLNGKKLSTSKKPDNIMVSISKWVIAKILQVIFGSITLLKLL